jgi:ribose transport system permease protein
MKGSGVTQEGNQMSQHESRKKLMLVPRRISERMNLSRFSAVYVWILLIVVFSLWLPSLFPTIGTVQNIAGSQAVVGLVTLGLVFSLAAGVYDLSIGYNVSFVSIILAIMLRDGDGMAIAITVALVVAIAIGLVNAFVVVVMEIDSFIGTLATGSILTGLAIWVSQDTQVAGIPTSLVNFATDQPGGVPAAFIYLLIVAVIAWYVLEHTPFGRRLYAIGGGKEASRLAGVRTGRGIAIALVVTAVGAGLAAILETGTVSAASPDLGPTLLLPAFAAAFLGATQISPGRPNVWGALIATYLLATGSTGLELAGAAQWVPYMFNGVALLLAVGLTVFNGRLETRRMRRTLVSALAFSEGEDLSLASGRSTKGISSD